LLQLANYACSQGTRTSLSWGMQTLSPQCTGTLEQHLRFSPHQRKRMGRNVNVRQGFPPPGAEAKQRKADMQNSGVVQRSRSSSLPRPIRRLPPHLHEAQWTTLRHVFTVLRRPLRAQRCLRRAQQSGLHRAELAALPFSKISERVIDIAGTSAISSSMSFQDTSRRQHKLVSALLTAGSRRASPASRWRSMHPSICSPGGVELFTTYAIMASALLAPRSLSACAAFRQLPFACGPHRSSQRHLRSHLR